eukprot:CAMPEP_0169485424 /NCGR_PEP_ID=MMETSP1042-20121227/32283_1 /TAXON_ID=464988 /ORGANISM="Hemiselmis andersenii, Strain CCMP1180" /LENGTH=169 /DNA_ID=CAMNT_0009600521 /DNA_START=189 /DNA_END=698 /DNA_ORIENTATION=+
MTIGLSPALRLQTFVQVPSSVDLVSSHTHVSRTSHPRPPLGTLSFSAHIEAPRPHVAVEQLSRVLKQHHQDVRIPEHLHGTRALIVHRRVEHRVPPVERHSPGLLLIRQLDRDRAKLEVEGDRGHPVGVEALSCVLRAFVQLHLGEQLGLHRGPRGRPVLEQLHAYKLI